MKKFSKYVFLIIILMLVVLFVIISNGKGFSGSYNQKQTLTVAKDGSGDYLSIQDAIDNIDNGGTIIVFEGVYDESLTIPNTDISVVGTDKKKCIIENTTGKYKNAPIYAYGNFVLANLTVKMTLKNVCDWIPTYDSNNVLDTFPGYAIHIDHRILDEEDTMHFAKIVNCDFYSEAFPAAGVGINSNQTIEFVNCTFERNSIDSMYWADNWKGAFVVHCAGCEAMNEKLILRNNQFFSNYGYAANFIMNFEGETGTELTAINNSFWSEELQSSDCVDYLKGKSKLNKNSAGNTAHVLNYE